LVSSSRTNTGVRAVVLADTHIKAASSRRLPDAIYDALRGADVVLHAGDVVTRDLLDELGAYAPVHAVLGNNDGALAGQLPESLVLDLEGVRVAMVHDSGARTGRPARMKRRFPDAQVVVYGHSHLPDDSEGVDGQRLFNPGSPTERRRAPSRSFGVLEVSGGVLRTHEIVALPS
jgi:putative phosphoesterase